MSVRIELDKPNPMEPKGMMRQEIGDEPNNPDGPKIPRREMVNLLRMEEKKKSLLRNDFQVDPGGLR